MTVAHTLEVVHGLFTNLKVVVAGAWTLLGWYQTINLTDSNRWQGIDYCTTTGSRYVKSTWNTEIPLRQPAFVSYDARDGK
jgi:hypothetical protein